jgi:hypothetical protein
MCALFCVEVKNIKGLKYNSFTLQKIEWNGFQIVSLKTCLFEEQSKISMRLALAYNLNICTHSQQTLCKPLTD